MDKASITLTVNNFISVTKGSMGTGGITPDVSVQLLPGGSPRITLNSDASLSVSGGDPNGSKGLMLTITVLPCPTNPVRSNYVVVGLIVKQTSGGPEVPNAWDSYSVGSAGPNTLQVNDRVTVPGGTGSVSYEFYVVIQTPTVAGAIGDFGLIDPRITNT